MTPGRACEVTFAKNKKRRDWAPAEVKQLKAMMKQKTGAAEIGGVLKRTPAAIRQKVFALGVSFRSRGRSKKAA